MSKARNHGVVFGATGLMGWAVINQLLSNYPEAESFSKITAIINRPVTEAELHLSTASPDRPQLQIASGIDLENGTAADLARELKRKIDGIEDVTHMFYFVFKELGEDYIRECEMNCGMMQRVVDAFGTLTSNLKSFVYPGGTRVSYGIYTPGGTFHAPLVESMVENLPEDYAKTVAYPWFRQILTKASSGRGWTWTEVCPDVVVGFTPNGSNFSLALHWAQYLSLYAFNHGITGSSVPDKTVEVPFPGSEQGFDALLTPVSSRTAGRVVTYAALHPQTFGGQVINIADRERPSRFRDLWPVIASWFGLIGVGPGGDESALKPGEYIARYKHLFRESGCQKALACGIRAGSTQLDSVGWWLSFDRQLSLEKLQSSGFSEERDPSEGWTEAFERFRAAGIIL